MKKIVYSFLILLLFIGCTAAQKTIDVPEQEIYTAYKKIENKPSDTHTLYLDYYLDEERNKVLNLMKLGLYSYQNGYDKEAEFAFNNVLNNIESLNMNNDMSDKAKSLWSGEDSKLFVGEPYERAMAYYYRGLLYLKQGDYENARASFKGGILQDSKSENTEYQSDFKSLFLLEALLSKLNGEEELFIESIQEYNNINTPVQISKESIVTHNNIDKKITNEIYHYPKSEQDCHDLGLYPKTTASGTLMCMGISDVNKYNNRNKNSSKVNLKQEHNIKKTIIKYDSTDAKPNLDYPEFNYPEFKDKFIYIKQKPTPLDLERITHLYNIKFDTEYSEKTTMFIICEKYSRYSKLDSIGAEETCNGMGMNSFYKEIAKKESLTIDELVIKYMPSKNNLDKNRFENFKKLKLEEYNNQIINYNKEKILAKKKFSKKLELAKTEYEQNKKLAKKEYLRKKEVYFKKHNIEDNNIFILIDTGLAPTKYTGGVKDSELHFSQSSLLIPPTISINGDARYLSLLDDLYYQATTRGGRGIDKIIQGKVAWKDEATQTAHNFRQAGKGSWEVAKSISNSYESSGNAEADMVIGGAVLLFAAVAGVAAGVGEIAEGVSNAVVTKADARYWNNLPGGIYLYMDKLPKGKYEINVQAETSKTISIEIVDDSVSIHHITTNVVKPSGIVTDSMLEKVLKEKENLTNNNETKGENNETKGENNETIGNKITNFFSDIKSKF